MGGSLNCEHSWAGGGPEHSCQLPSDDDPDLGRVWHECHLVAGHVGRGVDLHECECGATDSHEAYLAAKNAEQERYELAVRREAQLNLFLQVMEWKPGDYGWRDRPPTPEEVEAHKGMWIALHGTLAMCGLLDVHLGAIEEGEHLIEMIEDADRWRPVTRELWPAPWPEVTP